MTVTYINLQDSEIDAALHDPRIAAAVNDILGKEGGITNDANDNGGITNDGISLRYAKGVGLDLNNDGQTTSADIRLVTPDIAKRLYVEDFVIQPKMTMLSPAVWPWMFDFAVNSGPPRAIMKLQDVLNSLRPTESSSWPVLDDDGVIGRMTANALLDALTTFGLPVVQNALCDSRQAFCNAIVTRDPKQADFIGGWTNRINSFRM